MVVQAFWCSQIWTYGQARLQLNMCLNVTELYHAAGSLPGLSQRGGMSSLPAALLEVRTLQLLPSDLG